MVVTLDLRGGKFRLVFRNVEFSGYLSYSMTTII